MPNLEAAVSEAERIVADPRHGYNRPQPSRFGGRGLFHADRTWIGLSAREDTTRSGYTRPAPFYAAPLHSVQTVEGCFILPSLFPNGIEYP